MKNSSYCWQQKVLHWVSAAVILWILMSGFWLAFGGARGAAYHAVASFNVALGTLYIPVFLLRCWFLFRCRKPASVVPSVHLQLVARGVHLGLYCTTALVLFSGILMMNRPIDVFGWLTFGPMLQDAAWRELWLQLHRVSNVLLTTLVGLHVGAVILHELSGRRILRRMMF